MGTLPAPKLLQVGDFPPALGSSCTYDRYDCKDPNPGAIRWELTTTVVFSLPGVVAICVVDSKLLEVRIKLELTIPNEESEIPDLAT